MKRLRLLALGAVGAIALTACGDSSSDSDGQASTSTSTGPATSAGAADGSSATAATATVPPTTAAPDLATALADRSFLSSAVDGFTLVDGSQVSLTFDGPSIGAAAGCNQLSSTWTLEGDVLVVGQMAQTDMACEPAALMDQDTWLASVLSSRPTLRLAGDALTIAAEGSSVTLLDAAASNPDRTLEGTTWVVDTLMQGDISTPIPPGASAPTLLFDDGTLAVDTSCNTGTGPYRAVADTVTFGPIAMTRMACTDPVTIAVEPMVLEVLRGTATVEIEGDSLTLRNGTSALVAHASPDAADATADGLVGPTWTLESASVDGAPVAAGERAPTLAFDWTTVAVDTGCNTGSGGYSADATTITFEPVAITLMLCPEPAGTMETTILGALTGAVAYAIGSDGALTITNAGTTLRYVVG